MGSVPFLSWLLNVSLMPTKLPYLEIILKKCFDKTYAQKP